MTVDCFSHRAIPVGAVSYMDIDGYRYKRDVLFCYDLKLPESFVPKNEGKYLNSCVLQWYFVTVLLYDRRWLDLLWRIFLCNDWLFMSDGEVDSFKLIPIMQVAEVIRKTQFFKPNCSLVIIDFLFRHGYFFALNYLYKHTLLI